MVRAIAASLAAALLFAPAPARTLKHLAFAILEDYDKGEDLDDVAKDFDLFRELGVTTWRGSFGWDDYEPERGTYDFDWLHKFADLAARKGITLRPYIGYTPKWAGGGGHDKDDWNDPPKRLDDWYRFVRALASAMRRHSNIVSYEIYNEENVAQWWDGTVAEYAAVLERAAQAVHDGNPRAQVILGGMVYPDVTWLREVCGPGGNGRRFAILPFHAYPETWTPSDVTVENYLGAAFESRFVGAADAVCGRKPIWINEAGFATIEGRSERDQAEWWLRAAATFGAEPRVEEIGIYEIKDMKPDRPAIGDVPNYHLGITDVDRRKKLAFSTLTRVVNLIGRGAIAVADDKLHVGSAGSGDVFGHAFIRADGHQIVFVWTRNEARTVEIALPTRGSHVVEYAISGEPIAGPTLDRATIHDVSLTPGHVRVFDVAP